LFNQVRIISGSLRGRKIVPPKGIKARPTTDIAKEGLFNILEHRLDLDGMIAYDLFSGTGNITFELVSRGVEMVYSIDISPLSQDFIRRTAKEFGVEDRVKVVRADVWRLAKNLEVKADLIFADPPFTLKDYHKLHELVFEHELLNPGGMLVIEHPDKADFEGMRGFDVTKNYGNLNFSFFINSPQLKVVE
ncbi:MAG: RsmD family RNA methyltransferase, partial [Bacteroidota bacterium]